MTPEVPSETNPAPGAVAPTPIAEAALSPPPPAIGTLSPCEPPGGGDVRLEISRDLRTLDQARHGFFGQARRREQGVVPAPPADIEPERAGGVGHFGHRFAREAEAHVILGQEHPLRRLGDFGLVRGDPQHFRRGEAGHGEIAGALRKIRNAPLELVAFGERAAVIPQDRRPQRLVLSVEQGRAMHLAREADAGQSGEFRWGAAADRGDRGLDPLDPVGGVLLAPQRLRTRNAERGRSLGDHALRAVDEQRFHRRSADVQPQKRLSRPLSHRRLPFGRHHKQKAPALSPGLKCRRVKRARSEIRRPSGCPLKSVRCACRRQSRRRPSALH